MTWHRVMALSGLEKGKGKSAEVGGLVLAFFNVNGEICAIQNQCLHRGGPLGEGYLEGNDVTCPWHAWQFNVKTGECGTMPGAKQKTFKTKVEKGEIYVDL